MMFSSVLIEMGDIEIEIEIRRSNKAIPGRSRSVAHRMNGSDRKKKSEEKLKTSQSYWDYSTFYGERVLIKKDFR